MGGRSFSSIRGFTIMEVLVVVMIMGLLLGLAVPSFVSFSASQKVKTASFDLYAALVFARSEAIKRRQTVTVTPVTANWKDGWTVATLVGGVNTPLRTQDALTGVVVSTGAASVVYRLDGRLVAGSTVKVLIQPQTGDASISNRCLRVDLTGLPKTTTVPSTITDSDSCP